MLTVCLYLIGGLDVLPLESPSVDCLYLTGGLDVLLLDSPSVDCLSVSHRRPGCFTVRLAQSVDCLYLTGGLGVLLLDSPSVDVLPLDSPRVLTVCISQEAWMFYR